MIAAAWAKVKQAGPAWYWVCDDAHFGDLYQVCAFAAPFRNYHGRRHPIHLIATTRPQAEVARLFTPCFETVTVAPALQGTPDDWARFYASTGLPAFGLDTPMIIFPVLNPWNAGLWNFTIEDYELSVTPLIKRMLHLPPDAEPCPPAATADRKVQAQALCALYQLAKHRSVILCPYARSDPADATPYFAALATALQHLGYRVFTSIAGAETPIPGTAPIKIPFSLLPGVAEYAGWVVTVRSGVADIVSSTTCRKSIIYQSFHALRNWNLAKLGLCRDAAELVFRFGSGLPGDFAAAVIGGVHHFSGGQIQRLSAGPAARTTSFSTLEYTPAVSLRHSTGLLSLLSKRFRGAQGSLRITNVPPSCARSARQDAATKLSAIAAMAGQGQARLFACRDSAEQDFFEPVEPLALSRGNYYRAAVWHTILVIRETSSASNPVLDPTLPDDAIAIGVEISLADARHTSAHREMLTGRLPLCHAGAQFLQGWSALEDWGLWSFSCYSVLKINLGGAPQGDVIVELGATVAAFSSAMPAVAFGVRANGFAAGSYALPGSATPHRVEIVVPHRAVQDLRSILLEFIFPEVKSPYQQGLGPADHRPIGLGIRSIRVSLR